ncbi:MAG: RHS repeat-associated core domain-containing protein [Myxococcota bacterium]
MPRDLAPQAHRAAQWRRYLRLRAAPLCCNSSPACQQDDGAAGSQVYYDVNGNVTTELVNASPASTSNAITIEYTYDATLQDRVASVRTKMNGVWTQATSSATYLALGGYKTLSYANGITETNTRDSDDRLTRRKTTFSASTYTDINLTYDKNGNITVYDDSTGLRHNKYYLAMDGLNRLRCTSRSAIGACTGAKPWETSYLESLDYDASGNRTNRRSGQYATADDETYALVTGPTDIINDVTYGGTNKLWSSDMKGDLTSVKDLGNALAYTWDSLGRMSVSNDVSLSPTKHDYSPYGDRFRRTAPCNTRLSWYFYRPFGAGGVSPEISYQEEFGTCADGFPNEVHVPVYLEGRPVALVRAQRLANGTMQSPATYWLHSDQLGTPVLVTNASKVERWRWENDPFGRADPIEHTVFAYDQNPDWVVAEPNATTVSNTFTAGAPLNINNLRAHFSVFDVKAGATRTAKDYVQVKRGSDSAVIATLTGALGAFWGPWVATPGTSQTSMIISYTGDSKADGTAGIAVDKLEYTTSTNGRFVMYLRMPGQIWDNDAKASSNYQRWYRPSDGRYLSPDPIGLAGGEAGYFGYVRGRPLVLADRRGLEAKHEGGKASDVDGNGEARADKDDTADPSSPYAVTVTGQRPPPTPPPPPLDPNPPHVVTPFDESTQRRSRISDPPTARGHCRGPACLPGIDRPTWDEIHMSPQFQECIQQCEPLAQGAVAECEQAGVPLQYCAGAYAAVYLGCLVWCAEEL